jgi:hypothetical protein
MLNRIDFDFLDQLLEQQNQLQITKMKIQLHIKKMKNEQQSTLNNNEKKDLS